MDSYTIPDLSPPEGSAYQWTAVSVMGRDLTYEFSKSLEGGWKRVPADRHPGLGKSEDGFVQVDGLALVERPLAEALELQKQERDKASNLINAINEAYMLPPYNEVKGERPKFKIFGNAPPPVKSRISNPRRRHMSDVEGRLDHLKWLAIRFVYGLEWNELDAAIDGTIINHNTLHPIGPAEFARRKRIMKKEGRYSHA